MANEKRRLIDADALPSGWMLAKFTEYNGKMRVTRTMPLSACPTVDAVEVVHGRWVNGTKSFRSGSIFTGYCCSNCDNFSVKNSNYCPNCGAKMNYKENEYD